MKKRFCESSAREVYTIKRLMGGAVEVRSDSPWLPEVTILKSGEEYVTDNPYGKIRVTSARAGYNHSLNNLPFIRVFAMSIMINGSLLPKQMEKISPTMTNFLVTS